MTFALQNSVVWAHLCSDFQSIKNRDGFEHVSIGQIMAEALRTHPQAEKSALAVENAFEDIRIARAARGD